MARPAASRQPSVCHAADGPAALLGHAVSRLVEHVAGPPTTSWPSGPLVIVSDALDAASGAVGAAFAARGVPFAGGGVVLLAGPEFDREVAAALGEDRLDRLAATLAARRLVVADRIDRICGGERQQALVHLIDTSMAAGTTWAVSLPFDPDAGLLPQLASRLRGGLMVMVAADHAATPRQGPEPSLGRIIRAAARHHDVTTEAIRGPSRGRTVVAARSLAMYLARRLTGRSFQAIGRACGGRDHTTALHGARTCEARLAHDPALAADAERLATTLGGPARDANPRRSDVDSPPVVRGPRIRRRGRRRTA